MFGVDSNSYPTSISTITWHMGPSHIGEYVWVICALTPNTHVAPSNEFMGVLRLLHPLAEVDFAPFVDDFHLETKVTLNWEAFVSTLVCSSCLSFRGLLGMVHMSFYEIVLFQMILWMVSTSFTRYVGTLLEVMFHV